MPRRVSTRDHAVLRVHPIWLSFQGGGKAGGVPFRAAGALLRSAEGAPCADRLNAPKGAQRARRLADARGESLPSLNLCSAIASARVWGSAPKARIDSG